MSDSQQTPSKQTTTTSTTDGEKPSLNVNAKSFVPKMDSTAVEQPASTGTPKTGGSKSSNSNASPSRPQPTIPAGGMFPPGAVPFPGMVPPPGMMASPMMPGMMPGFPPGMMAPGAAAAAAPLGTAGAGKVPMSPMMMPPSPTVPGAAGTRQMAPGATFVPGSPLMPGMPGMPGAVTPNVSVGNATLVAKRSNAPPKFGCVLLAGVTGVGKTTIGNQLVSELSDGGIPWKFFCGADHLKDAPSAKPAPWDTTKSVFDGLSEYLENLLKRQNDTPIRGLLIDKQLRGVEDLYYLTSLLRSKGLLLWGVIGMDCASDDVLASRLGNGVGLNEKIKFHRVIYSRIQEAAKQVGLWRTVDASQPKSDACKHLRTMVLGCSSQSPTKQFNSNVYHDSPVPLVDNYTTYASVMSNLFTVIPRNAKGVAMFPGTTAYNPMPANYLDSKKNPLKEYAVRRKVDGVKYVLFYDGAKLYLIPRHMRCVFEMSQDAWLGVHLSNTGKFVVDGELVKTTKDRSKEKFVVYDVAFWGERGSTTNLVKQASWKERQERLKTNLCSEGTAFFPKKGDIVVVHQATVDEPRFAGHLLEATDYPCDGLVFHSTTRRDELPLVWRPPECVAVDFRLGAGTPLEEGQGTRFIAEVFDQSQAKYAQYRSDTITITGNNRPTIIEGAIVACTLDTTSGSPTWVFQRVRSDLAAAALKSQVDEILKHCVVTKQQVADYIAQFEAKAAAQASATTSSAPAGTSSTTAGGAPASTSPGNKQPALGTATQPAAQQQGGQGKEASRQVFGSALSGPGGAPPEGAAPSMRDIVTGDHKKGGDSAKKGEKPAAAASLNEQNQREAEEQLSMMTDAEKLNNLIGGSVKVKKVGSTPANDMALLNQIGVGSVSVVGPGEGGKKGGNKDGAEAGESATATTTTGGKKEPPVRTYRILVLRNVPQESELDDVTYYAEPFGEVKYVEWLGATDAIVCFKHSEDAHAMKDYKKFSMFKKPVKVDIFDSVKDKEKAGNKERAPPKPKKEGSRRSRARERKEKEEQEAASATNEEKKE